MSNQHKKPILAFVMLAVIAAAVIGNQMRAGAERSAFITAGRVSAHTSVSDRAIFDIPGIPTIPTRDDASKSNPDPPGRPRSSADRPTRSADRSLDAALPPRFVSDPVQGLVETVAASAKSLSEPVHVVRVAGSERDHACPERSRWATRGDRLGWTHTMDEADRSAHGHGRGSPDNRRR